MSDEKAPAFMFYPKDYTSDEHVQAMSLEQEGAYLRLLLHGWLHRGIPTDLSTLARICRVPRSKMARLWPGVAPCFKEAEPGRLVNPRQEKERAKQEAHRAERSRSGRKGAESRHGSAKAQPSNGHGSATVLPVAKDGFPFPFPFPDNGTPLTPRAGGDAQVVRDARARIEAQVEQARQFAIGIGERPNRDELREIRGWFKAGHPLADVQTAIERGDHRRRPKL